MATEVHADTRVTELPLIASPKRFLNRELSDLALIRRVQEESTNERHPLLERLRFLSIAANLLDQFYEVRVAALSRKVRAGNNSTSPDGRTAAAQIRLVDDRARELREEQQTAWETIRRALAHESVEVLALAELGPAERSFLRDYFERHVLPVLTPFTIDREHPMPFIPSGGICFIVELDLPRQNILVPLPAVLPRFVRLPGEGYRLVTMETVMLVCWSILFGSQKVLSHGFFQLLRDNELELAERSDDLLQMVESGLESRNDGFITQLKFNGGTSTSAMRFAILRLSVLDDDTAEQLENGEIDPMSLDIVTIDNLVGLADAVQLIAGTMQHEFPHLTFPPYRARLPQRLKDFEMDCFAAIREQDLLVHWPYETFDVVVRLLEQAAADPDVLAIKQTLYRTSEQSPIVAALIKAAHAGKSVTAVIELEARDNESSNVALAKVMERAGVQIVYGIIDLKVHCKATYIVRREEDETRTYAHLGTGNYHPGNARIYTDLSFFTSDTDLSRDTGLVFNYLTSSTMSRPRKLIVAPEQLRRQVFDLIDAEIAHAEAGRPAQIWAKINSLVDPRLIDRLYEASNAGVEIDLVVRRHCTLRPGIPGLSENIRVKSIIGRFLEHSRIYCFGAGGGLPSADALVYLSSADWMDRNFDKRVELMVPITQPLVHRQIIEQIMTANLFDEAQSWLLDADGTWTRNSNRDGFSAQDYFMTHPGLSGLGSLAGKVDLPMPSEVAR